MALRVRTHAGDGSSLAGATFEMTVSDPNTGERLEDVVIVCRVLTKAEVRRLYAQHTTRVPDPRTRQMLELLDASSAGDAVAQAAVVSWRGVIGADDEPLVCTAETVAALDDRVKQQIIAAVTAAEVTGRDVATFRPPA